MKSTVFRDLADARSKVGQEVGVSDWMTVEQERVNGFADVTGDHQWIHIDAERAKRESPFGAPIAHGYLTLSLLPKFSGECLKAENVKMGVNYGLNRVRFMSPVKVGSKLRARFVLKEVEEISGGAQLVWNATIELENIDKPACVAEMVSRWYY